MYQRSLPQNQPKSLIKSTMKNLCMERQLSKNLSPTSFAEDKKASMPVTIWLFLER
jgi:hypothetical protein